MIDCVFEPKYSEEVDWIGMEKESIHNKIMKCIENRRGYYDELEAIKDTKGLPTLSDYIFLNKKYGEPKYNVAMIYRYKIRREHLRRGLFKTQEQYFTTMIL